VNDTFFGAINTLTVTAKQLKLRDHSWGLAPMPKVSPKRKLCSMHKIVCSLYLGYKPIYRQRDGVKPELGFLLPLKLRVPEV
jgi:hypothetical protein